MIDFLKYRFACALFSIFIVCAFFGIYFYKQSTRGYAFTYSVDFEGGTQVWFKFSKPVSDNQLKDILEKNGWKNPVMRNFGPSETVVRVKEFSSDVKGFAEKMRTAVEQELKDVQVSIKSVDSVSGGVGSVLRWKSMRALLISLLLMLVYIWLRFWSLSYGVGAVIALVHDAIVIPLVFLLLDKEVSINFIGAILVCLGYSINDTIVIFTRIKQNLKVMRNVSAYDVANISINQTLRRTLLTSFATLLVVIALFALGGETLRDLSLALFVGIAFGTYSSIYIASPVMLSLYKEAK